MIVYKIDKQNQVSASAQISDMAAVLNEIPATLEILQNLLTEHRQTISLPTIDNYRADLQQAIDGSIKLTRMVAENSQQLCIISDQATKHLAAIDEHFGNVLQEKSNMPTKMEVGA